MFLITNHRVLADKLFLKKYMTRLLEKRNKEVKKVAESGIWKNLITKNELRENS